MNKKICPKILGIVLVSIIINLTLISKAIAATYYVDSTDGLDTNNGTSESTPWQTINKVNTSTFNPGDNILFKKGRIWREILIPPSSGTDGSPITFSSYGSGTNPTIYKSENYTYWYEASMIKQPGFENYVGTSDDSTADTHWSWTRSGDGSSNSFAVSNSIDGSHALKINKPNPNLCGFSIRQVITVTGNTQYYLEFWGKRDVGASGTVRLFDTIQSLYLQDNGTWSSSDNYIDSLAVDSETWVKKSLVFTTQASTTSLQFQYANYLGTGLCTSSGVGDNYIDNVYMVPGNTKLSKTIWSGSFDNNKSYYAFGMIKDGVRVPYHVSNVNILTELEDHYLYISNDAANYRTFFYRDDSGKPTNTEVGLRKNGIYIDNKNYVTIDGIDVWGNGGDYPAGTMQGSYGIRITGTSSHVILKNLKYSFGDAVGIATNTTTSDVTYDNIEVHDVANTGIYLNSQSGLIKNSKSHDNGNVIGDSGDRGGFGSYQGGNFTVMDSEAYHNGPDDPAIAVSDYEFSFVDMTGPIHILRNYAHNCMQGCMQVATQIHNSEISYNIIDGFGTTTATTSSIGAFAGIRVHAGSSGSIDNLNIYNNVIANGSAGSGDYRHALTFIGTQNNTAKVKNNVFYNNGASDIYVQSTSQATGFEIDNNIYSKSDYTNNWNWKGTNYSSLSAWNTARGFDTNSSTNNPDFVNAGSSDYRLKSTSWGIDRGIDVGLLLDKNGVTVPQGEGVDIGAYELSGSFSEVGTTDDAKDNGIKLRSPKKDEYKNDKTPKFRFRKMDDSSIEKYQVLVKEKKSGKEYVYIDDITPNGGKKEEDDNKKVWYKNDEIEVESKTKLRNMEYKWWVKAKNNLEQLNKSEERKLHIDTTKPLLTVTKIGNKIIGINETPTVYTLINGKIDIEGSLSENGDISIQDENNIEVCNTETLDNKTFKCSITTKNKTLTITSIDKAKNETLPISITRR